MAQIPGGTLAIDLAMKTKSLEILARSQLPSAQAHAILEALDEELTSMERSLATKSDFQGLRSDMAGNFEAAMLRMEVKMERIQRELSEQIEKGKSGMKRWTVSLVFGQTAVLAGVVYFALARLK